MSYFALLYVSFSRLIALVGEERELIFCYQLLLICGVSSRIGCIILLRHSLGLPLFILTDRSRGIEVHVLSYTRDMTRMEWQTVQTLIRLLLMEQSGLSLHCLPKPVCAKT